ncbi:hypothetical protein [Anaerosolibacter sp.]|uniref:hypothetical protein n=1 Tax=Anaerosolibacter sp. TaxID=1872527 RepID=UPI0039EF59E5
MIKWFNPPVELIQPKEMGDQIQSIPELVEQLKQLPNMMEKLSPIPDMADKLNPIPELIQVLEPISKVCYVLTHPILIWDFTIGISYWAAAIIGTIGILFCVVGYKKGVSISGVCVLIYALLKSLNAVIAI